MYTWTRTFTYTCTHIYGHTYGHTRTELRTVVDAHRYVQGDVYHTHMCETHMLYLHCGLRVAHTSVTT